MQPDRNNFSPRLGFAWRPLSQGSLVVRGGYGLYYNTSVYNIIAEQHGAAAAVRAVAERVDFGGESADPPDRLPAGHPARHGGSTFAIDPELPHRLRADLDDHGAARSAAAHVRHGGLSGDQGHAARPAVPAQLGGAGRGGIRAAAQLHLRDIQRQLHLPRGAVPVEPAVPQRHHGARASYQFSKSIDNAGTGGRGQGNTPVAQNWLDLSAERALSSFDARHNLNLQVQYSSGHGSARRHAGERLEGRAAEGLDGELGASTLRSGTSAHRDGGRQPFAGERHRRRAIRCGRTLPGCRWTRRACCSTPRPSRAPAAGHVGQRGQEHDSRADDVLAERLAGPRSSGSASGAAPTCSSRRRICSTT